MHKIKVVWLCHFVNSEIGDIIGGREASSMAPWMTDMIKLFENKEEIDVYIISPNYYNNKNVNFSLKGINYFFYKYTLLDAGHIKNQLTMLLTNYSYQKNNVKKIVEKIQPSLIHLFGSENTSYSVAFNELKDTYRSLITIQGFISSATPKGNILSKIVHKERVKYEKSINSYCTNYADGIEDTINVLRSRFNPEAVLYDFQIPTYEDVNFDFYEIEKKKDLVFFARVTYEKGIEDLLDAVGILKSKLNNISLIIVGGSNPSYLEFLINKCEELKITDNVTFAGFQKTQTEAHKIVASAKVFVLPTHFDSMPGSLRETMKLGVPIIANNVGGIPELNNEHECVKLVEKGDVNQLANSIFQVLKSNDIQNRLKNNAFDLINTKFSNQKIYDNLIEIYSRVLKKYENDKL